MPIKRYILDPDPLAEEKLAALREKNNPNNEPSGPFTGRCQFCGSRRLWAHTPDYGCITCGAFLGTE